MEFYLSKLKLVDIMGNLWKKFTKKKQPKNIFKQGASNDSHRARCAGPGSAFGAIYMHVCIWKIEVPPKKLQEIVIFTSMNIFNWYISTRPLHVNFGYICFRVIKYCVLYLYQLQVLQLNYKWIKNPTEHWVWFGFFIFIHRWINDLYILSYIQTYSGLIFWFCLDIIVIL